MKAKRAQEARIFEEIPNIGKRMAADFRLLGLKTPKDLKGQDPLKLYQSLNKKSGARQDPCVLDTFMAAVDFMNGGKSQPWWEFTSLRKKRYPDV